MTERTHNAKCVHATSIILENFMDKNITHHKCTWYCQQEYWMKNIGLISKEISDMEAKRLLEATNG